MTLGHPSRALSADPPQTPSRAEVLESLRALLPKLEAGDGRAVLPFGIDGIDGCLPHGGLALDALHEILPDGADDIGAALGFLGGLLSRTNHEQSIVIIRSLRDPADGAWMHGHGFNALGLDPGRLILVEAGGATEALWAMEEALRSGAPAAVIGLVGTGIDLKESRRLHLAAGKAGLPAFLLRPSAAIAASAAATRWRISAAPAGRDRFGLVERWRWQAVLERCRNGRTDEWVLEWDHGSHRFGLVAALADPAASGIPISPIAERIA